MAIFADSAATQTTAVGTSATLIFDTDATGIPSGATLPNLTIMNLGPDACYIGIASVTVTGWELGPGEQIVHIGYSGSQSSTAGDRYAICASGKTATVVAGLATIDAVV